MNTRPSGEFGVYTHKYICIMHMHVHIEAYACKHRNVHTCTEQIFMDTNNAHMHALF